MDLQGQDAIGVEELQQERKTRLGSVAAQQFFTARLHELPQRSTGQRPELDDALVGSVVRDFPAFTPIVARTQRLAQHRFQSPIPP